MNTPESGIRAYFKGLNAADLEGTVAVFSDPGSQPRAVGAAQDRLAVAGRRLHVQQL